jgi:hypothetical protein
MGGVIYATDFQNNLYIIDPLTGAEMLRFVQQTLERGMNLQASIRVSTIRNATFVVSGE